MCFVDLQKAFDQVPLRVLEWTIRKRGVLEAKMKVVICLHIRAKIRVRVGSELSCDSSSTPRTCVITTGLKEKNCSWKAAFHSKGLKVDLGRTKAKKRR